MQTPELAERIRRMPKAELHLHLEGALRWSTVCELNPQARALGDSPPWRGKPFASFEEFRGIFRSSLIPASGTEERIERHVFEVLEDLARQNVRYAEPILYLPFHMAQGLRVPEVLAAVDRGTRRAEREHAIVCRWIIGLNRGREAPQQVALALEALEFRTRDGSKLVAGFDVMSDDRFGIQSEFADFYRKAKQSGLRLRVHAGELGGAEVVRDAIDKLGANHLSHGIGAARDPGLLRELAANGTWFHVCPTSNVRLGAASDYATHPLREMLKAGCRVTLNSDDPILFGPNLTEEYQHAVEGAGCPAEEIRRLAINAFLASLLPEAVRARFVGEIEALFD